MRAARRYSSHLLAARAFGRCLHASVHQGTDAPATWGVNQGTDARAYGECPSAAVALPRGDLQRSAASRS